MLQMISGSSALPTAEAPAAIRAADTSGAPRAAGTAFCQRLAITKPRFHPCNPALRDLEREQNSR
jgi:hypothetical protein